MPQSRQKWSSMPSVVVSRLPLISNSLNGC